MESRIKGTVRGHNQTVTPPGTPHEPSDPTPKPRSPRKRKPAPDTPDAQPAPKKAKRQADEGERTRPPIPEIDGRLARAVDDARRLNGLTQADMGARMGMSRDAFGKRVRTEVSWLVSELIAAAKAVGLNPAEMLEAAGLSSTPGMSPEAVISRDFRLTPARRAFFLDQYRDAVARDNSADGGDRVLNVVQAGQ